MIATGCSGREACLTDLPQACAPLYEPTYENVFEKTLQPTCAEPGIACHAPEGAQAGLVLADMATARRLLLEGRVEPGNAACSLMMQRLESDEATFQMPPGMKLSAAERCAIQKWIEGGAEP